jgi:hypothetical protein
MKTFSKWPSLWWTLAVAGAGTIFACSGQTLDAGRNDREGSGGSNDVDGGPWRYSNPPSHSFKEGCEASVTSEFNGTWRGTFDDYTMRSGSRSVRLVVEAGTAAGICGSITFGDAEPPPLPTDREAPYAPGFEGMTASTSARANSIVDGFVYQFGKGERIAISEPASSTQLASINPRQPYKAWCEIQYSYPIERDSPFELPFSCLPDFTSGERILGDCVVDGVPVSCTQFELCNVDQYCVCTSNGCSVYPDIAPGESSTFSVQPSIAARIDFAGDSASGTIALVNAIHAFTLTRDP